MQQHSTSFWEADSFYAPCDFIIAGAGLAGIWTALAVKGKMPKATITIVERNGIPTGASTRNAGFACFGSPTEMITDASTMGNDTMWQIVEMRYNGIEKIRKTFKDSVIDFNPCGGYECYTRSNDTIALVAENMEWLNKGMQAITGQENAFAWSNAKLDAFGFAGFGAMVENKLEGGLHSGKLVQALMQLAVTKGIKILFGFDLERWENGNEIKLIAGHKSIRCQHLILTTNAFLPAIYKTDAVVPARGQVLVTAPIPGLKMKGTFHYDEGYYYFRNIGNRMLLGGARNIAFDEECTTEMQVSDVVQQELERFLKTHLLPSGSFAVSHRWSGIMAFTETKIPVIENIENNVWTLTGCNGMGVALTPVLADYLAERITGSFNCPIFPSSLHLPSTN